MELKWKSEEKTRKARIAYGFAVRSLFCRADNHRAYMQHGTTPVVYAASMKECPCI